ncbi:hypothetical protein SL003B_2406 [Polymorphum gilvum SL003B-26A1]|uniref:Uncharacterized protein n=1 Tax=Polymorphum gilvum (strain LMG 25793 / CGMCC 1.9160 / SL003B-26A1) TaxID=991905 RepID=F2J1N0_POLGS|nr:hypothetical protein SL003B_2406 [Polymorphum gilvum SL003B-26A1]
MRIIVSRPGQGRAAADAGTIRLDDVDLRRDTLQNTPRRRHRRLGGIGRLSSLAFSKQSAIQRTSIRDLAGG